MKIVFAKGASWAWFNTPWGPQIQTPFLTVAIRVNALACRLDPWCDFDAFGTAAITADTLKPGVLNNHIGT